MAKVTYIDPIATLSGKIAKRYKTIYMVRQADTSNPQMLENPCFTTSARKRRKAVSERERIHRTWFGKICKATAARLKDSTKITTDTTAYKEQQQYTTLRQYVWHQVENEMDA